jgi:hypothetical protein
MIKLPAKIAVEHFNDIGIGKIFRPSNFEDYLKRRTNNKYERIRARYCLFIIANCGCLKVLGTTRCRSYEKIRDCSIKEFQDFVKCYHKQHSNGDGEMTRFKRLVSIYNQLEIGCEFTKPELLSFLKGFFPAAQLSHLSYFFIVAKILKCCPIVKSAKGKKNQFSVYKKVQHIDSEDLKIAGLTYMEEKFNRKPKEKPENITSQKIISQNEEISSDQIQKVVQSVLILTEQNIKLKNEIEQLKKENQDIKQQNLFNSLIKKAEEVTGISL